MSRSWPTASDLSLVGCRTCRLVCRKPPAGSAAFCPRCGARLFRRKPESLTRTRALLLAAIILYLPANLLPITHTMSLTSRQSDTIISGVIYFMTTGSWFVAAVIFIASVLIPLLKLLILAFLLVSVQTGSQWRPLERSQLYRLTEAVGRWSMVDIFVVSIMVALVKLGAVAQIEAGPGAVYFAAVVIITMLAAMSFDPRLIWDAAEKVV